nr:2-amino-4-hydroxy-6-hydroxymethyldihydropteridine diphosphokinase [Sphingobium boeckii]
MGSNRCHGRHGTPDRVIAAARDAIADAGLDIVHAAQVVTTPPLGPSIRRYANAAVLIESALTPPALLTRLKAIERAFGRRSGRRWGARVIDLDIILWSGGIWASPGLSIPHPAFRDRRFVLDPLAAIAADWRDPVTGLAVRHLLSRLKHNSPVDPTPPAP